MTTAPYHDDEWWRAHYSGLLLELWQAILPPGRAEADGAFLIDTLRLVPGARLLDAPCGEGRVALALAARGIAVTAIDIAPGQIERGRAAALARGLAIDWRVGDMRQLPPSDHDAACCWGDSFGYFDEAGNRQHLAAVRGALRTGGRLAIEMRMVAELLHQIEPRSEGRAQGFDVRIERRFDAASGRLAVTYHVARDGRSETSHASFRIHARGEIEAMLAVAGFIVERVCGGAGEVFSSRSDSLRLVCRAD